MTKGIVFVVDDDDSVRRALSRLIRSVGLEVETFGSAQEFLDHNAPDRPACIVTDVRMPGPSGLDLQQELVDHGRATPIIFMTGHGTVPMSVRAMKAGAVDFLQKPVDEQLLLDSIRKALEQSSRELRAREEQQALRARVATLTAREREVFELVVSGMLNKQVAADLGASEKTIKIHRARVMHKMKAESLADLVRMAERLGICRSSD